MDQSLLRSSAVMATGTFVSRLLGFVRAIALTALLGVTAALANDTFATANTVPNQVYNLIAGGLLNAVLVPQITRASRHEDGGQAFLDRLLTVALVALAAVTVLVVALAPLVPVVLNDGSWDAPTRALAVAFAFWCLPQVFFYGLYTVLGQVLNARGRFGAYMWAPVLNNVVAIGGIIAMYVWIGGYDRVSNPHPPSTWTPGQIALLGGTAVVTLLYVALNAAFLHSTPLAALSGQPDVGFVAARHIFGEHGARLVAGLIAAGLASSLSGLLWAGPRVAQAMVDVLLQSGDALKAQLARHQGAGGATVDTSSTAIGSSAAGATCFQRTLKISTATSAI